MDSELRQMIQLCHHSGDFVLSGGARATEYYDLAPLLLDWKGITLVTHEILQLYVLTSFPGSRVRVIELVDAYACLELCPVPLVSALTSATQKRGLIVRKQAKSHGTAKWIEGTVLCGDKVLLVEDVTSTGVSVMYAIRMLEDAGCEIFGIVTIVNRQEGCDELLRDYSFWHLVTKVELQTEVLL